MAIKFRNKNIYDREGLHLHDNTPLNVYVAILCENMGSGYSVSSASTVVIKHIAAHNFDEALDIITKSESKFKWVEKTRADYARKDHWEAWVDHNRAKEYAKYLRNIATERTEFAERLSIVDNMTYNGDPGVISTVKKKLRSLY